jgi:hypothetical protein
MVAFSCPAAERVPFSAANSFHEAGPRLLARVRRSWVSQEIKVFGPLKPSGSLEDCSLLLSPREACVVRRGDSVMNVQP